MNDRDATPPQPDRRSYLTKAAAIIAGGAIAVVAPVAGLLTFLDPLRRKGDTRGLVRVTTLSSLPENGEPRKLPVLDTLVDAWNRTDNVPVGSVFVQRTGPDSVRVLNAICPHLGCAVTFSKPKDAFFCPCHKSSFTVSGAILDPSSPSPRGMDQLDAQVRPDGEVWVKFQNFRKGVAEKIPV